MVSHPAPRILTPGHVRSPGPGPGSPGYPASSSLPSRAARSEASVVPGGTSRTIVDWLAVASRVPSSAHRWPTPGPKPLAPAGVRRSSSTHSGGEQGAVLRPRVDGAVAEAVGDGVDADVEQHPLGRHQPVDAQRVVEAVAAAVPAERLADAEGHVVAEDGEAGPRGQVEQVGHA